MHASTDESTPKREGFEIIWKSLLSYLIWFAIRNAFTKLSFLNPLWVKTNDALAAFYVSLSAKTLHVMGYSADFNARNILMGSNQEMYVGDHCLGIAAMSIFTLIIIFLKGPLKHKVWFILLGLSLIFLANWIRIVGLAFMLKIGSAAFFQFNHKYTYLVLVYGLIFFLIIWFEKKFSKS